MKFFSASSQKNAYLATWPGDIHTEECPASFTPAKKKETTDYYESLSPEQIQDKLASYMRRFTSKKSADLSKNGTNHVSSTHITSSSISNKERYILPQKSLDSQITQIDDNLRNIPIVFYGKTYVEFVPNPFNPKYNQIHLKRKSNKKLFLYMENGETDKYIPENIDEDTLYMVVFIGIYEGKAKFSRLFDEGTFLLRPTTD